jgi:hypothetical protein
LGRKQRAAIPASASGATRLALVESRRSRASILLSSDASLIQNFAAGELQRYLQRMTGVETPIQSSRASALKQCLVLGKKEQIQQMMRGVVAVDWPAPGSDEYTIELFGDVAMICGGSDRAILYGAYHLLENLGCRWLAPGEDFVPKMASAYVSSQGTVQPALKWRGFFFEKLELTDGFIDWLGKQKFNFLFLPPIPLVDRLSADNRENIRRRGLSLMTGGHTPVYLLPIGRYSKTHPEWFSVVHGRRSRPGDWPLTSGPTMIGNLLSTSTRLKREYGPGSK